MKTSDQINELAAALSKAQGELEDAKKDQQAHQYRYADLAQVLQIVRPVLSRNNLSVVQAASMIESDVSITTRLMHSSGQWIEETLQMPAIVSKAMSPAQVVGSLITYGRRYQLTAMIGVTQEDNDATGEKVKEGERVTAVRRTSARAAVMNETGKPTMNAELEAYANAVGEALDGEDYVALGQIHTEIADAVKVGELHENTWLAIYDQFTPNKRGKLDFLINKWRTAEGVSDVAAAYRDAKGR